MLKVFSSLAMLAMAVTSRRLSSVERHYAAMNQQMANGDVISPPLADNSTYGNTE